MEFDVDNLAGHLRDQSENLGLDKQFWLGIAGAPGSGKSTLSQALVDRLGSMAIVIPMDGFHYYRSELNQMNDPEEAHRRRGAPFTFNIKRFVSELSKARQRGEGSFPSFDHGSGDPVERDIQLDKNLHQVVIVEGNYLLLDEQPWSDLRSLFDESWYLEVDIELCMERVKQRFLKTGRDEPTADFRIAYNDRPNAELVRRVSPSHADKIITT